MNPKELGDKELVTEYRNVAQTTLPPDALPHQRRQYIWRMERANLLLNEIDRRGRRLLKANGWPDGDNDRYINIHTGAERTLAQAWRWRDYPGDTSWCDSGLPMIFLHWLPRDLVADPTLYKPINTQLPLFG